MTVPPPDAPAAMLAAYLALPYPTRPAAPDAGRVAAAINATLGYTGVHVGPRWGDRPAGRGSVGRGDDAATGLPGAAGVTL